MSSAGTRSAIASPTLGTSIPTGTISAHIGSPPNTTDDYYVAKYLLMALGETNSPLLGVLLPPARPADYVYETRGPKILVSMSIALSVIIIITGLRLGVRVFRRELMFGWDHVFIIPGALLAIAWPTLQMYAVIYGGAGKHIYDVTYEEYGHFKTFSNLSKPVFFLAVGFIKVSICFFNHRLTALTSRKWSIFNNVFVFLLFVYIMMALFCILFQCNPPYAGWDPIRIAKEGKSFHCISDNIVGTTLSVIHVIIDFGLLSVPLIVLWKLTINDILWNFVALENWTLIDLTFGVVAASLPILSAVIPKSWQSVRGTHERSHAPYGTSGSGRQKMNSHSVLFTRSESKMSSTNRNLSDSTENIIRTDVIELKFQNKSQFLGKTENEVSSTALESNGRRDHEGKEGQCGDQDL